MSGAKTTYERFTVTDGHELRERVGLAQDRFVGLMRSVPADLRLERSDWTAREVAGHVLTVVRRYTRRDPTSTEGLGDNPREVDRINAEELSSLGDAPKEHLIDELIAEMDTLRDLFPENLPLDTEYPFHGGITIDAAAGMANLIGEFLIHGRDVATTFGRAWPIDQRDAVLILNGVLQILPAYAEPTAKGALALAVHVKDATAWLLDFHDGHLMSRPRQLGDRPDVKMRTPADALMLALYSRLTPIQAAQHGTIIVGGRRPWRIRNLSKLIQQP